LRAFRKLRLRRTEVINAISVGLAADGNVVTQALPAAILAYDKR
jgi:hypothetical protein